MTTALRLRTILLSSLLAVACGTMRQAAPPPLPARAVEPPPPRPAHGLYAVDEALEDALSGPWEYLGTGSWPGISRMHACVFRNQRVLIVNAYCALTDAPAVRIDIYSPSRGRVRIYAESNGPVSSRTRGDYFTFTAETEPPPSAQAGLPPLALAMSFQDLRAYDQRRYDAYLPTCYGGQERSQPRSGCLGPLAARAPEWTAQNRAFLDRANDNWYRMVREMRAAARRYGRDPE